MGPAGVVSFKPGGDRFGLTVETSGGRAVADGEVPGSHGPGPDAHTIGRESAQDGAVADMVVLVARRRDGGSESDCQAEDR